LVFLNAAADDFHTIVYKRILFVDFHERGLVENIVFSLSGRRNSTLIDTTQHNILMSIFFTPTIGVQE